jgi:hypothetical protein
MNLRALENNKGLPSTPPMEWEELSKRRGRFKITQEAMRECPELIMKVMGTCIVRNVKYDFEYDYIEYTALSPQFSLLGEGAEAPVYDMVIDDKFRWFKWK